MTRGSSPRLSWPKRERWSKDTVWLSTGQRSLLFWIEARMARGWHTFTIDEAAAAAGIDRSNVSRGLDRLASLSLIGRRSRRGRGHRTVVWRVHRNRAIAERAVRASWPSARNVATSTTFGGYLSREAWTASLINGGREAARRLAPPRLLYCRCAACGRRSRLGRWGWRRTDGFLEGVFRGDCRSCRTPIRVAERLPVPPPARSGWSRVADFEIKAGGPDGFTVRRRPESTGGAPWSAGSSPGSSPDSSEASPSAT